MHFQSETSVSNFSGVVWTSFKKKSARLFYKQTRKWHLLYNYNRIEISVFAFVCIFMVWLVNPMLNFETVSTMPLANQVNRKR